MKAMRIGGRLRRLRQERRLTQAQMARELGISASYLTLLESNQRPVTVRGAPQARRAIPRRSQGVRRRHRPAPVAGADGGVLRPDLRERRGQGERRAGAGRDAARRRPRRPRPLRRLSPPPARRATRPARATMPPRRAPVTIPSEEVTEFIQRRLNYFPGARGRRRSGCGPRTASPSTRCSRG